jgi:RPA family protein
MEKRNTRQTAYKVWVQNVHTSAERLDVETNLPYLDIAGKNAVRVHLFGSVVGNSSIEESGNLVIDDSTASIAVRVWGEDLELIKGINIGDLVFVVGRYAKHNDERYIRPEIVRLVTMDWALYRRLELTKEYGIPSKEDKVQAVVQEQPVKEVEPSLSARETIITEIEKKEEVTEEELVQACNMPQSKVLFALEELLKEGEIFCPKKGVYSLV